MNRAILFLFLAGCAVVPTENARTRTPPTAAALDEAEHYYGCRTECGLYAPLARSCFALQAEERLIVHAYAAHVKGWTEERVCRGLRGTVVYVAPSYEDGAWTLYHEAETIRVYGLTLPTEKVVMIGTEVWEYSALGHELGHVLLHELEGVPGGHFKWTPLGLCAAINETTYLADDCTNPVYLGKKHDGE